VTEPDPAVRRLPLVDVTLEQIAVLLSPLLSGRRIAALQRVDGGLTNTILRVSSEDSEQEFLVRIFGGGRVPWKKEQMLLARIGSDLPVPRVLLADGGRSALPYPSLVYQWIEGMTLNAARREATSHGLLSLAAPLGRILAEMAKLQCGDILKVNGPWPASSVDALLSLSEERLLHGRARTRLGERLADFIWEYFSREADRFRALGSSTCLVHGDFGGRNVLVAHTVAKGWEVTGVVDWEDAFTGWAMWDIGSLFRYATRYDQAFRDAFERGYRKSGGTLPDDWWRTARLLDATRQVATLDTERERPAAFADCRELLEVLVCDG
jgi:aminoglycoside phosphotransferase (APT) family kinase protein